MMRTGRRILFSVFAVAPWAPAHVGVAQPNTVSVDLKLRTGGGISGLVVEHDHHGLVVVRDQRPYAFAWNEIEPGKAYVAWRKVLVLERGGDERLSAQDFFDIGRFALRVGRNDLAADEFARARRLDRSFEPRIRRAFDDFRERQSKLRATPSARFDEVSPREPDVAGNGVDAAVRDSGREESESPALVDRTQAIALTPAIADGGNLPASSEETRTNVMIAYRTFGAKVEEVLGKDVVLVETDHFLIWTDWDKRERLRLVEWSEAMYAALCEQFGLGRSGEVFLAKCPMFCWRNKASFRKFARYFDGYSGDDAVGYTRSIEKSGHVHVVLVRQGNSPDDLDRFASTLVHEGTHAFLHRLHSTRLIPHWVNEGFANVLAERVLGDRCNNAESAALLARPYVRYDWPIGDFLRDAGPIAVEQYPLAHSVVGYLLSLGSERFAGLIRGLKDGRSISEALAANYDGLSLEGLEAAWRDSIRRTDSALQAPRNALPAQVPRAGGR